jgi:hypothetical protein
VERGSILDDLHAALHLASAAGATTAARSSAATDERMRTSSGLSGWARKRS